MSPYVPKPYEPFGGDIIVKVDLSNYETKTDLKNISHINISNFVQKSNLASLKTEVDKLDIDKLTPVPNDLAKLSNIVKNDVVKKTEYDKLVVKVNNIGTTGFVSKTKYEKDGSELEKKIIDVGKKLPDGLVTKTEFDVKLKGISDRVTLSKSKHLLVENELKKLKSLDLSYFGGKNYFEGNDGTQNASVFQVKEKYFDISDAISVWNSKGIYKQSLNLHGIEGDLIMRKAIRPASVIFNKESRYLFQTKPDIIASGSIVNIYIVYELSSKTIGSINALKNSLFGATKVIKPNNTTDPHKYIYSGNGLAFDRTGQFKSPDK